VHPTVAAAQKKMGSGFDKIFKPDKKHAAAYGKLYRTYTQLGGSLTGLLSAL